MKHIRQDSPATTSLRDRAYNHIRAKLISGGLPPGARLSNRILANEIGMSFIPVREAISQLVSEGLVVHEPKLGCFVKELNRQEIAEWYDFREGLEVHAVLRASETASEDQIEELQSYNDILKQLIDNFVTAGMTHVAVDRIELMIAADAKFHMTILRIAGNRLLLKTISHIRMMTQVFVSREQTVSIQRLNNTRNEHQGIIDAISEKDGELARKILTQHLRTGCERALNEFDQLQLRDVEKMNSSITSDLELQTQMRMIKKN
jgi:DNA-binding GntR family transcriptional regulator